MSLTTRSKYSETSSNKTIRSARKQQPGFYSASYVYTRHPSLIPKYMMRKNKKKPVQLEEETETENEIDENSIQRQDVDLEVGGIQMDGSAVDDAMQRRERRRLMVEDMKRNFNMEQARKRFQEENVVNFSLRESRWSTTAGAMASARASKRLQKLLGVDEIRLNDRHFMENLVLSLQYENEEEEYNKEQKLAEEEKKRIRKLILEGVIEPEEEDEARRRAEEEAAAENNADLWNTGDSIWPPCPEYHGLTHRSVNEDEEKKDEEKEGENEQTEQEEEETKEAEDEPKNEEAQEEGENEQKEEEKEEEEEAPLSPGRFSRPKSTRVISLMEEEDMEKLYRMAEELVFITTDPKKK